MKSFKNGLKLLLVLLLLVLASNSPTRVRKRDPFSPPLLPTPAKMPSDRDDLILLKGLAILSIALSSLAGILPAVVGWSKGVEKGKEPNQFFLLRSFSAGTAWDADADSAHPISFSFVLCALNQGSSDGFPFQVSCWRFLWSTLLRSHWNSWAALPGTIPSPQFLSCKRTHLIDLQLHEEAEPFTGF